MKRYFFTVTAMALALLGVTGCKSIGPDTVQRDRLHDSSAVAESWKEQLLLNIVKTRYGDAPAFLEVASVVAGYSLETGVSLDGQYTPSGLSGDTFAAGGVSARYTDRPTISYTPTTGERFARSLLAPVPVDALMFVIQSGAPADFLLSLTAQSIEGHQNQGTYGGRFEPGDPEFAKLLQLMRILLQTKALEIEVTKQQETAETWLRFHSAHPSSAGTAEAAAELKTLLSIPPSSDRVRVAFGMVSPEPEVVAIRTRSLMQMLSTLGVGVQIPEEQLTSGGAVPVVASGRRVGSRCAAERRNPMRLLWPCLTTGCGSELTVTTSPRKPRLAS